MKSHSSRISLSPVNGEGSQNTGTANTAVSPTRKRKRKGTTGPPTLEPTHDATYAIASATNKKIRPYEPPPELRRPLMFEEELIGPSNREDASLQDSVIVSIETMPSRRVQKAPAKDSSGSPASAKADSSITVEKHELYTAQDALLQAQTEIAELKRVQAVQQERFEHDQKALKQDLVLGHVMMQETLSKQVAAAQKRISSIQKAYNEQKKETDGLQKKLDVLTERYLKSSKDIKAAEDGRAYVEALLRTLESDLDELRDFENEEAARLRKENSGLPPQYKDYRKRQHQAPYERHDDAGSFDTSKLEDTMRSEFDTQLCRADKKRLKYMKDDSENKTKATAMIFCATSQCLTKSCRLLRTVLTSNPEEANWIAHFILELLWNVASACEVRPVTIYLTNADKTKLGLGYKEVDEILLEALKKEIETKAKDNELPLYELQRYLTQINCIHDSFINLKVHAGYDYFGQTSTWLEEQVEAERVRVANS